MKAENQNAEAVVSWIGDLKQHPGYEIFATRYTEIVEETKKKILDTDISDQETHDLKQQLKMLERTKPQDVIEKMETKARMSITTYKTRTK